MKQQDKGDNKTADTAVIKQNRRTVDSVRMFVFRKPIQIVIVVAILAISSISLALIGTSNDKEAEFAVEGGEILLEGSGASPSGGTSQYDMVAEETASLNSKLDELFVGRGLEEYSVSTSHKVPGYDFATIVKNPDAYGFVFSTNNFQANADAITVRFENEGYSKKVIYSADNLSEDPNYRKLVFENNVSLCMLEYFEPYQGSEPFSVLSHMRVTCAQKSAYEKLAEIQNPYNLAIRASSDEMASTANLALIGDPEITASQTAGYKMATINIAPEEGFSGDRSGLFYLKPNGEITFLGGAQEAPLCSIFSTLDARKAWVGTECYGDSNQIVKLTI